MIGVVTSIDLQMKVPNCLIAASVGALTQEHALAGAHGCHEQTLFARKTPDLKAATFWRQPLPALQGRIWQGRAQPITQTPLWLL